MNGIIVIDKPEGWTSHDVVAKLRGAFKEKRIGHGGTLDPMATGVLPVFVGRATRAAEFSENAEKEYIAGLLPGVVTDTQDTTGTVLSLCEREVDEAELLKVLPGFIGEQDQMPPMYSAVKINGKTLYSLARKGIEVERKTRRIRIYGIDYLGRDGKAFQLRIQCSKGTYIRTLCSDIGDALGTGGAMCSLRRVRAGSYTLDNAVTLEDALAAAGRGEAESLLRPVDSLFENYPALTASGIEETYTRNGRSWSCSAAPGKYRVYGEDGCFLMLGEADGTQMNTVKNFFEVR